MRTQTPQNRVKFARALRKVFLGVFAVSVVLTFVSVLIPRTTAAATASTINFQARLETNSGAIVPDGTYNVEFKLYGAASGGSAEWTEDYTYNSGPGATDARIRVANGYLTVNLGSLCPFTAGTCQGYTETSIDWTQQQWLTMNIGGTGSTGTYPTMGDGEMNPRLALTAVPYAFEAGTLGATSGTNVATLSFSAPTSSEQLLLPAASGTQYVCYQGASGCGFLTGSGAGVQLQAGAPPGTPQHGNFNIDGTGIAGVLQAGSLDTASAAALGIGASNATAINLGNTTSNILTTVNGTVLVKPTSGHDSTTAFQVQSAGGASVLVADTVHGYVGIGTGTPNYNLDVSGKNAAFNSSKDGSTGSFTSATALPVALRSAETATANGYVYVLGGSNGSAGVTTVYYDSLNADGTLGTTWNTTTVLPQALYAGQAIVANGYIYYIGGWNDSVGNWSASVYYAKLNSDGTIGAWVTATSSLPDGDFSFTSVEANGYLYVIGGKVASSATSTNKVYYAKLNSDGSLGSWTTATNTIPQHLQDHVSVVANGYVYVIGGWDSFNLVYTTSSYYAKLNSDGSVGTWNTTTNVPGGQLIKMRGVVANGYVYLLGGTTDSSGTGYTSALSTIYYARLNSDGTLGTWTTNSQSLPNPVLLEGAAEANGYIYTLAGANNTNTLQTAVYYGSTARLQIAGSLDLIGLTGQNLAADSGDLGSLGSVGGSIYAGNIFANGSLSVTSNAQFWNGLNSAGTLSVTGTATVQTTSTTAFQVQNASASNILSVDSTNKLITIGHGATGETTGVQLVLDSDSDAAYSGGSATNAPAEVNGGMFYSPTNHTFLCGVAGAWETCTGLLYSNTSSPTAVNTCTSACAAFNAPAPIPANYCKPGRVIHVEAQGVWSSSSTTIDFGLYYGTNASTKTSDTLLGAATQTSQSVSASTWAWRLDYTLICFTASSVVVESTETLQDATAASTTSMKVYTSNTTTPSTPTTTSTANLYIFPEFGASASGNTATLEQMIVTGY